jgi:transcriptional regulator with XRE-family HTH domain
MVRLRWERLRRGWTQAQLATRAEMTTPDISRIETGRLVPYPKQLIRMGRVLKVDPSTLLDEITETVRS